MISYKLLSHTSPLCFLPNGNLVCYKRGDIIIIDGDKPIKIIRLYRCFKERFLGRFKLLSRFLRLGIRCAASIDERTIVLSKGNCLYELDLFKEELSEGFYCGPKKRALCFSLIEGIQGFDDGIYYGDYLGVLDKVSIEIHKRVSKDKWETVYVFKEGEVDHIHNIVPDPYRQCVWIYSGDFGEAAAIWKATDGFKTVESFMSNNQMYRGCIAFSIPEGLIYATDAPYADNYIYLMEIDTGKVKKLKSIDGSCIYGCQWKDKYIFSSTVEGDLFTKKSEFLFSRKRGAGIKNDDVHMYCGNLIDGFSEILTESKDRYPYYAFQYGVFKFPSGINKTDFLYYQPFATKKHDLDLMILK